MTDEIIKDIRKEDPASIILKTDRGLKKLIIVESRTKAKEIMHFLNANWNALPTNGYIKDIIQPKNVPADKKADYGRYGIDVNSMNEMLSFVPGGMKTLTAIRNEINTGKYDTLVCAGDPDRAGSGISAQVATALYKDCQKHNVHMVRACWHEITRKAIINGLANAIELRDDSNAVNADRARAVFDRLFGYSVSPLLWKAVAAGTSGGRAQSPALRLIVDRERKRMNFTSASYYSIDGEFKSNNEKYKATLISINNKKIATSSSFNDDGTCKDGYLILDKKTADNHMQSMQSDAWHIADITEKAYRKRPPAPYKTSTFQQDIGNKLGIGSKQVMSIAQKLFENGIITYIRTNSSGLSTEGAMIAHKLAIKDYGKQNVQANLQYVADASAGSSLDGHEAIRPATDDATQSFRTPAQLKARLDKIDKNAFRVYDMIYRRTLASQMNDAVGRTITISLENNGSNGSTNKYVMNCVGTIMTDLGWIMAMSDNERANKVPHVSKGDKASVVSMSACEHHTTPPARFTEPQLVAKLEELGIGRPATYAQIVSVNQERGYVNKKNKALYPTWRGMQVAQILEAKLPAFVDYAYTANMETCLDDINTGKLQRVDFLHSAWSEIDKKVNGLAANLDFNEISRLSTIDLNNGYQVRCSKNGYWLENKNGTPDENGYLPSVPLEGDELYDGMSVSRCKQLFNSKPDVFQPRKLGVLTDGAYKGYEVWLKSGKYGEYAQALKLNAKTGEPVKTVKPVNMPIPEGFDVVNAGIADIAPLFMSVKLPRRWPDGYFVGIGKKGGYIGFSKGKTKRAKAVFVSMPAEYDAHTITHDDAVSVFNAAVANKSSGKSSGDSHNRTSKPGASNNVKSSSKSGSKTSK